MDDSSSRVLLTLRRFIGVPLPGTDYYLHAAYPAGEASYRVRLVSASSGSLVVLLPRAWPDGGQIGTWWYAGALRATARLAHRGGLAGIPYEHGHRHAVVDVEELVARGEVSQDIEVTPSDGLDYVVGDLVGDPLWHGAAASVDSHLYRLIGFDLRTPDVVRVYLARGDRVLGVDLAVRDDESGQPRLVGWWASAKVIAILNPDAPETLAAHRVLVMSDEVCDEIYDLTRWA
ncbi:hypothetical protein AB0A69_32420 [Streptomyces sp. NPDC045431]|uniref:hypothetical protein n=1 Tax=Streptomyces sp. NPDC045431 TaxID=3155613 RepID=UPI0033E0F399